MKGTANRMDIFKALGWLKAIDQCSYLNNEHRRLIGAAGKFMLPDSSVNPVLERLRNVAHSSDHPLEKAEILLYCAAIGHWRRCFPDAARDASEAVISYNNDDHRRAVALWMLGMAQWEMLENYEAHKNALEAKKIFEQRKILFQHFPDEKDWYKNRIWEMDVAIAAYPEEIASWLNCFERSSLRPPTQHIVRCMRENVRQHTYPNVYVLMQDLQEANRLSKEIYERAELCLEFGLAVYQLGNKHFAIELLRNAVKNFHPGIGSYHKQVVARCLVGAVEWRQTSSRKQAEANWKRCTDEFEDLQRWADRDQLQDKVEWYAHHREILQAALLEQCNQHPEPPSDGNRTRPNEATHPPRPSDSQDPNLYQDLLIKVRWDEAIAERLIEFERKKAPDADRNEWIRRAIERWMRDNQ